MAKRDIHDAFFKRIFGRADLAAGLWARVLPPTALAALDVARATRVDREHVGDDLRVSRADLIYEVPLRDSPEGRAFVFMLMEHRSTPDPILPFRLAGYGLKVLEDHISRHTAERGRPPTRLPPFLPIVLHQGRRPWRGPRRLADVFDMPPAVRGSIGQHLLDMELLVDDLAVTDDAAIEASTDHALTAAALMTMRFVRDERDIRRFLGRWVRRLDDALLDPDARATVEVIARYLYTASDRLDPEEVVDAVRSTPGRHPEVMMNLAQKFEERGRLKGLAQGREKGREEGREEGHREGRALQARSGLLKLLRLRFGPLDPQLTARVEAADLPTLERWTERIFTAESPEALLGA